MFYLFTPQTSNQSELVCILSYRLSCTESRLQTASHSWQTLCFSSGSLFIQEIIDWQDIVSLLYLSVMYTSSSGDIKTRCGWIETSELWHRFQSNISYFLGPDFSLNSLYLFIHYPKTSSRQLLRITRDNPDQLSQHSSGCVFLQISIRHNFLFQSEGWAWLS